jgi:hypothetical protein
MVHCIEGKYQHLQEFVLYNKDSPWCLNLHRSAGSLRIFPSISSRTGDKIDSKTDDPQP